MFGVSERMISLTIVAFENTKVEGVLDNIDSDYIGVCYDSGHDHAFFNDKFNFLRFKNKI